MKKKICRIIALVVIMAMMTVGLVGCKEKNTSKSVDSEGDIQKSSCDFCGETDSCEKYKDDVLGKMNLCEECKETIASMSEKPEGYFQYILKKSSDDSAEQLAKGYGMALENLSGSGDMSSDMELAVTVGKKVRDMLADETDMNFDWMEKISLLVNSDITKDAYKFDMGLAFNEKRLISLVMLANMSDRMGYFQVPELNETYLGMDFDMIYDELDVDMEAIGEVTEVYEKLFEALPGDDKVATLMTRYSDLVISCVENVEQDKEEVQVGELTDEFTVLKATIDESTVKAMLEVIVAELKEDKEVKEIIYDVTEVVGEVLEAQDELDADEVYDDFIEALEELEEELDTLEEEEFEIVLKLYVDKEGQMAGWTAEIEEESFVISSLMITDGSKFAYEFEQKIDGVKLVLEGTGEETSSELNGDFRLKYAGLKLLDITLEDVKTKEMEEGYFNGTVSLSLGSGAVSAIEDEMGDDFPLDPADLVLKFTGKSSKDTSDMSLSLYESDELLGAVSIVSKNGKAESIVSPNNADVAMIADEDEIQEWIQGVDTEAFVENLEEVFGEDFIAFFEELLYSDVYEDDYYEDDYWYEDDYYYEDDYWYEDDDYYEDDYWYDDDSYYDDDDWI